MKLTLEEKKTIGLASLGGMLENYDFVIYGIFSVYFANQFFPDDNQIVAIIKSYLIFILGYVARPVGGLIFSRLGDEKGRKKVLTITVALMGSASLGIGILPTYEQIGVYAPILLLCLRLLQGIAHGGELPSMLVYVSEYMPDKRALAIGMSMAGVNIGLLLGMLANYILNQILSEAEILEYGWRIPFLCGFIICFVSYKIRKTLHESAIFENLPNKTHHPIKYILTHHLKTILAGIFTVATMACMAVAALIFMPTYLHQIVGLDNKTISQIMPVAILAEVLAIYFTGVFANNKPLILIFQKLLVAALLVVPIGYFLICNGYVLIGTILITAITGCISLATPLFLTYLFEPKIRFTGVALCYNTSFAIFGAIAPILISFGISAGIKMEFAPTVLIYFMIFICFTGLYFAQKSSYSQIN